MDRVRWNGEDVHGSIKKHHHASQEEKSTLFPEDPLDGAILFFVCAGGWGDLPPEQKATPISGVFISLAVWCFYSILGEGESRRKLYEWKGDGDLLCESDNHIDGIFAVYIFFPEESLYRFLLFWNFEGKGCGLRKSGDFL